jgi:PKHD-type hydroxylase
MLPPAINLSILDGNGRQTRTVRRGNGVIVFPTLPCRNQGISGINFRAVFSPAECDRIAASAKPQAWQTGMVGGYAPGAQGTVQRGVRSCEEQRLPIDAASGFPLNRISYEISNLNSEIWRFDLSGFVSDDPAALMRYEAGDGGHYAWHVDVGRGPNASRKIGFTLQLTDPGEYDGADLEFHNMEVDRAALRRRGTLIAFPAYWLHRVAPVTRGRRLVVVGWVHGPTFR